MTKIYYQKGIKILLLVIVVSFLLIILMGQSVSAGYTFATNSGQGNGGYNYGGLELTIDSKAVYNGVLQPALSWDLKHLVPGVDHFFNFDDVKPGDMGEHTISLHVKKNNAYVCLDFENLQDFENGMNEPEGLVDNVEGGELSQNLEFFAWRDDGDDTFEVGERVIFGTSTQSADIVLSSTTYAVADAHTGGSCQANSVNYVGIVWCAGDLTVDLTTAEISCDGSNLGNIVQTDSMSVDVSLRAVQASNNNGFVCEKRIPPQEECLWVKGNNGHGNEGDHNDDSNPGSSNDPDDYTDDDGYPPGQTEYGNTGGSFVDSKGNACKPKGNNGHGNEEDGNDDSNPGQSNNPDDDTDDDGIPPGQVESEVFHQVTDTRNASQKMRDDLKLRFLSGLRLSNW